LESLQKQGANNLHKSNQQMTLGKLVDNMIQAVDLKTNEENLQIPSQKPSPYITAILRSGKEVLKLESIKDVVVDENGLSTPKKMKLTTPSPPVRSPSIQQQKDLIINDDDSNQNRIPTPTPPPPQRGRTASITKSILRGLTTEEQIRLSGIHENAKIEEAIMHQRQQQKESNNNNPTPSSTPVTTTTLTPSPSPNGNNNNNHASTRVSSPSQSDAYPIDPIIPRNRKNSMTWKILNEEEQSVNSTKNNFNVIGGGGSGSGKAISGKCRIKRENI
jgi:hypothetical protein